MRKTRTLDRYIFRELLAPFALSLAALTLVFFIQKMYRLMELVVSKGATLPDTVKLLFFILPTFLAITIPMSTLVASLTAFTRLSSDSEITALKASRVSLYEMLRPVAFFALLSCLAAGFTSIIVMPYANHALKVHLFNMVKAKAMTAIEPGVFNPTFDGIIIFVNKMPSADLMEGIFISDMRSKAPYVITAKRGRLTADQNSLTVSLTMEDGEIHTPPKDAQSYTLSSFALGTLYLDIKRAFLTMGQSQTREVKDIPTRPLWRRIREQGAAGAPDLYAEHELYTRLTIPYACLFFGIIGAPLGIRRARSGKSAGIAIALAVFLAYYALLGAGKNLAEAGVIPVALAYGMPSLFMTAATLALVYLRGQESAVSLDSLRALVRNALSRRPKGPARTP